MGNNNRKFKVVYWTGVSSVTQIIVGVTRYSASKGEVQFYDAFNRPSDYFSNVQSVVETV